MAEPEPEPEPTDTHWLRALSRTRYICDVADDGTGDAVAGPLAKLVCCERALEDGVERFRFKLRAAGVRTSRGRCVRLEDCDEDVGSDWDGLGERAGVAVEFVLSAASARLRCDLTSTEGSMAGAAVAAGSPASDSEEMEMEGTKGEEKATAWGCGLSRSAFLSLTGDSGAIGGEREEMPASCWKRWRLRLRNIGRRSTTLRRWRKRYIANATARSTAAPTSPPTILPVCVVLATAAGEVRAMTEGSGVLPLRVLVETGVETKSSDVGMVVTGVEEVKVGAGGGNVSKQVVFNPRPTKNPEDMTEIPGPLAWSTYHPEGTLTSGKVKVSFVASM